MPCYTFFLTLETTFWCVLWTENWRTMPSLAAMTGNGDQDVVAADTFRLPPTLASPVTCDAWALW